jgi:hypothetical protein
MTGLNTDKSNLTFGDLALGQYAFHEDNGFDHGTVRQYFFQRDFVRAEKSVGSRRLIPVLCHDITQIRKNANAVEIVLLCKQDSPREWFVDARYQVIA